MTLRFPTPHKYDKLGAAARRLARVPRYGRLIAMLPVTRFDRLVSEPATFWEVYTYICANPSHETGILDSGLRATRARQLGWAGHGGWGNHGWNRGQGGPGGQDEPPRDPDFREYQVHRACDILGAVAFEMFCVGDGPHHAVSDTKLLRQSAINRLHAAGVTDFFGDSVSKSDLYRDLESLFAMDAADLKYFIFAEGKREVRWTDITTQAFFAAYWACRWANDADRSMMWKWLPDPLEETNSNYDEFWRMVAEMPEEACDPERYELLLSPLYDGSIRDEEGLPIRSTELIYRTWERMKETDAGKRFRGEFRELLAGSRGEDARVVAQGLLTDAKGNSHFLALCDGERGTGEFAMGALEGDEPYGDELQHQVVLSPFRLHRYCVTNLEYELFDVRHQRQREFEDKMDDVSRNPVASISWYDAWCFARFAGEWEIGGIRYRVELPTEAEWEYACRAGSTTVHCFGDDEAQLGDYAWFGDNSGGRTHSVGGKRPNAWGFYDMHGNVWEWCADWYEEDFYRRGGEVVVDPLCDAALAGGRVIRGGSCFHSAWFARSASRSWDYPSDRFAYLGFRLASVPAGRAVRR